MFTEKFFKCQICEKKFSNKGNLNQHMNIHNKSKSFKCDVCFKVFNQKSNLAQHYKTHTGEKPFACQVCDRKFAVKSALVQHQVTHSDVRSFKCSICPESRFFKTKKQLRIHEKFHYEPKYSCSKCNCKSYTSGNLTRHEKTHIKK